ncbi:MAG: S49 family peptidase, partial [Planctomycetota bacterium]
AAKGRNMPREKMEELAQGRIYAGSAAKELGLIDGLGTLEDALAEAKKAAGLDPDEEVDTLVLPKPQSFFEQLFGGESISGGIDTEAAIDVAAPAELRPLLMQVRVWRKILGRERAVLALPCHVRLR